MMDERAFYINPIVPESLQHNVKVSFSFLISYFVRIVPDTIFLVSQSSMELNIWRFCKALPQLPSLQVPPISYL